MFAETSHAAYENSKVHYASTRQRIINAMRDAKSTGLTSTETAKETGISLLTVRPNMTNLYQEGVLRRAGMRPNPNGSFEYVMVLSNIN